MLCATALRNLDESYLLSTVEDDGFEETVVDRAMGWLDAQCEEHPALGEERAALLKTAGELVEAWETRHVRRCALRAVFCVVVCCVVSSFCASSATDGSLRGLAAPRFRPPFVLRLRASRRPRWRWATRGGPSAASSSVSGSRARSCAAHSCAAAVRQLALPRTAAPLLSWRTSRLT